MGNLPNKIKTTQFIFLAITAVLGLAAVFGRAAAESCSADDPCGFGKICFNGKCADSGSVDCTNHSQMECYDNDVYWYDSCGTREEKSKDCGEDSYLTEYQCSSTMAQQGVIARGCDKGECQEVRGWIDLQNCDDTGLVCRDGACRAGDATPPLLYSLLPSGEVNSSRVVLSLATDEKAECRYSYYDVGYDQMGMKFATGDGIRHSVATNLAAPGNYIFYVRCRNGAGNVNLVSNKISFSYVLDSKKTNSAEMTAVGQDLTPPAISAPSLKPSGKVYTAVVELSLVTGEKANCRYDTRDLIYASMTSNFNRDTGGTVHYKAVTLPGSGSYAYYARCRDTAGNESNSSAVIEFEYAGDSTSGLLISDTKPAGAIYQKTVALEAVTDSTAICRYSATETDFESMVDEFSSINGVQHLAVVTLDDFGDYNFSVACVGDGARDKNGTAHIVFQYKDSNGMGAAVPEPVKCDNAVLGKSDGICEAIADCVCDPDCGGQDSDCAKIQDNKKIGVPVLGLAAAVIAGLAGVYMVRKRAGGRSEDSGEDDSLGL